MERIMASSRNRRCMIFGAGGHGRVVLDVLANASRECAEGDGVEVVGFIDSERAIMGRRIDGVRVLGTMDDVPRLREELGVEVGIVAIGDNGVRRAFAEKLEAMGIELINAIHPSANIARNASLGKNIVVAAGALVSAHCQIGDSVILNTGCIVDHESLIGTATHVCPGARLAGRVTVESGGFVGIGATIIQNIRVGYEAVVGAGAVVIADVEPMSTVVGVPARPIKAGPVCEELKAWLMPEFLRNAQLTPDAEQDPLKSFAAK